MDAAEPTGIQLHLSGDSAQLIVGAGNSVGLPPGPLVRHRAGNDLGKPPTIRPLNRYLTLQRSLSDIVTSLDCQAMVYWVHLAIQQGALYYRKYQEG